MKKLFAILFVLIMTVACACADEIDFSGMTQTEILNLINAGRNALILQKISDGLFKFEADVGITIVFKEIHDSAFKDYGVVELTVINDSDINYNIRTDKAFVNGWKVTGLSSDIEARRRAKDTWVFTLEDADISSVSEVEDLEIYLLIYPEGGNKKKDSLNIPPIVISLK